MQHTYHIHINGIVQGVGFRPFVCRLAEEMNIKGWVSNTNDGVHIEISSDENAAATFYKRITESPPANAVIIAHHIQQTDNKTFTNFSILESSAEHQPDVLLTPDIAICDSCKQEINDPANRRYHYAFTTCLNCGPRYSITKTLPYDRKNTTMADLEMCPSCSAEFKDIKNSRHYSQINSCKACAIQMHLYDSENEKPELKQEEILDLVAMQLRLGKIIAVKGMGGYLLMCDATNEEVILKLRARKQRPAKPFALLYANLESAGKDVFLRPFETVALKDKSAPIVLVRKKTMTGNDLCTEAIAPGLDKIGVMLPSTPLLYLIAQKAEIPLIATSGNVSGSPIICKDEDALKHLSKIADFILTYDREIVAPQDDSVMQFTDSGQKIILRRSRGLAPNYFPNPFDKMNETILATGGELKSAFAFSSKKNLYISQYLGDQGNLEAQESYEQTWHHLSDLLQTQPEKIIIDKHPSYAVSQLGKQLAKQKGIPFFEVQHHKAHFGAVLAENNLLQSENPVLGFIWDGTGYGDDRKIWGSELFLFEDKTMKRMAHLDYFPQLLGDKMSKEPRLSALSLLKNFTSKQSIIQYHFSETEWNYYQKVLQKDNETWTSSMGRFLDGLACILGVKAINSYEGEAVMQLEAIARSCSNKSSVCYPLPLKDGVLDWHYFLQAFLNDIVCKAEKSVIAWKVFYSLSKAIEQISHHYETDKLAFSGGVFQNALLTDLITEDLSQKKQLYFHRQLSPNDECIGFGQLACYQLSQKSVLQHSRNPIYSTSDILS